MLPFFLISCCYTLLAYISPAPDLNSPLLTAKLLRYNLINCFIDKHKIAFLSFFPYTLRCCFPLCVNLSNSRINDNFFRSRLSLVLTFRPPQHGLLSFAAVTSSTRCRVYLGSWELDWLML